MGSGPELYLPARKYVTKLAQYNTKLYETLPNVYPTITPNCAMTVMQTNGVELYFQVCPMPIAKWLAPQMISAS